LRAWLPVAQRVKNKAIHGDLRRIYVRRRPFKCGLIHNVSIPILPDPRVSLCPFGTITEIVFAPRPKPTHLEPDVLSCAKCPLGVCLNIACESTTVTYPLFGLRLEDYDSLFAEKLDLLLKILASTQEHYRRAADWRRQDGREKNPLCELIAFQNRLIMELNSLRERNP